MSRQRTSVQSLGCVLGPGEQREITEDELGVTVVRLWCRLADKSANKSANKCRWQRRRDRPRPSRPLRVRRWQAAIALLLALARFHDPPHSSSNRTFAPRCQPHGTPLTCCTGMLPHTPTPTNTPLGDGTSLNWMPLRAASA